MLESVETGGESSSELETRSGGLTPQLLLLGNRHCSHTEGAKGWLWGLLMEGLLIPSKQTPIPSHNTQSTRHLPPPQHPNALMHGARLLGRHKWYHAPKN